MYTYWFDAFTTSLAISKEKYGYHLISRAHRWDLYEKQYIHADGEFVV